MQFSKKVLFITVILPLVAGLNGCSSTLIGVREGVERVSLADANQVTGCNLKGTRTISVLAKVGFIDRDAKDVEDNLYQIALNDAVDVGADTVVKGESQEFGKRIFKIYKCRN